MGCRSRGVCLPSTQSLAHFCQPQRHSSPMVSLLKQNSSSTLRCRFQRRPSQAVCTLLSAPVLTLELSGGSAVSHTPPPDAGPHSCTSHTEDQKRTWSTPITKANELSTRQSAEVHDPGSLCHLQSQPRWLHCRCGLGWQTGQGQRL